MLWWAWRRGARGVFGNGAGYCERLLLLQVSALVMLVILKKPKAFKENWVGLAPNLLLMMGMLGSESYL